MHPHKPGPPSDGERPGSPGTPPRSMREFDYFSTDARPVSLVRDGTLPEAVEAQMAAALRARRRAMMGVVTSTLLVAASAWLLWGSRDELVYAFSPSRPPLQLGDVVDLTPADIPHNGYVELSGITEHRGITQKIARGLWPSRSEYWYFRLVGSRGVFLETPPDKDRYGMVTRLTVRGRAVDPARSALYARFLAEYRDRFAARPQEVARIIQVGREPGQGRLPFVLFIALVGVLSTIDVWTLLVYARHRRAAAGLMR